MNYKDDVPLDERVLNEDGKFDDGCGCDNPRCLGDEHEALYFAIDVQHSQETLYAARRPSVAVSVALCTKLREDVDDKTAADIVQSILYSSRAAEFRRRFLENMKRIELDDILEYTNNRDVVFRECE